MEGVPVPAGLVPAPPEELLDIDNDNIVVGCFVERLERFFLVLFVAFSHRRIGSLPTQRMWAL
jgi:hypothetical protein